VHDNADDCDPASRTDGDHDKDDFESLEKYRLEGREPREPIDVGPVASRLFTEILGLGPIDRNFGKERQEAGVAQNGLAQPTMPNRSIGNPMTNWSDCGTSAAPVPIKAD
jgi:hypothetical protein